MVPWWHTAPHEQDEVMAKFDWALDKVMLVVLGVCACLLALMISVMTVQVALRYGFSFSLPWAEEAIRFSLIWMSLLAAAVVAWRQGHMKVDIFLVRMTPASQRMCRVAVLISGLIFCSVLLVTSVTYLEIVRITTAPALQITLDWIYAALPISAVLIGMALSRHLLSELNLTDPVKTFGLQ